MNARSLTRIFAVAALLCGKVKPAPGSTTVAIVSGGNVDRARLADLLR